MDTKLLKRKSPLVKKKLMNKIVKNTLLVLVMVTKQLYFLSK